MARKPNYAFERNKRSQAKAKKREAKRQAKQAAKDKKSGATPAGQSTVDPTAEPVGGATADESSSVPE